MSFYIEHVQIGDGSQYQQKANPLPDPAENLEKWKQAVHNSRISLKSGTEGHASCSVLWDCATMNARIEIACPGNPEVENPQPDIILAMDIHTWDAIVAYIASKRRELELRSFHDSEDDTEEV